MSDESRNEDAAHGARFSVSDSAQLAAYLAELSRAGLPVGAGLRALSAELPHRTARAMKRLANRLDRGEPLDKVLADPKLGLPEHLRGLVMAGVQSGHLADVLEEYVAHERLTRAIRRSILASLAYPALLLVILLLWIGLIATYIVPPLVKMYKDFDIAPAGGRVGGFLMQVPDFAMWLQQYGLPLVATILVAALLSAVALGLGYGRGLASEILSILPLIGPVWRNCGLAQCSDMLALLTDAEIAAPSALRLTGRSLHDVSLTRACFVTADRVQAGSTLSTGMESTATFPPIFKSVVKWGEQSHALPGALRTAAEMFRTRADLYRDLMQTVVPPLLFLVIASTATMLLSVFITPMLSLIQNLT